MRRIIALTVSLVLAVVATGNVSAQQSPTETSAVTIPPGQIDRAVQALDRLAPALLHKTGVPGMSVAVVHNDKVVYLKGFGVRKVGANTRVDADTVFELASVSKPLGASVVAALVGRGTVKWNDPVSKYVPGFTLANRYVGSTVTIADMYAHRSGLPDHAGDLLEDLGYGRATILKRLALEPLTPFRISYAYTNFGLTAGAQAAANAAKMSWEALSRELVYRPLGMNSTSSSFADYEKARNKAVLHVRVGSRWIAKYTRDADAQSPAGGASSTARDMAQWLRLELGDGRYNGKQIINEAALLQTWIPSSVSGPPSSPSARTGFYGLGMNVSYDKAGRLRLSHSGGFASGGATNVLMLPSEHLGIVVLTNGMPIGVPETLSQDFMDLAEFGKIERDWFAGYTPFMAKLYENRSVVAGKQPPAKPQRGLSSAAYTGTYQNAFYGAAQVRERNGRLVMFLGPQSKAFPLTHWSGNTFTFYPSGENAVGISSVTFFTRGSGAQKMVVEYLNENNLGAFVKQ